jgi:hypothetical protein
MKNAKDVMSEDGSGVQEHVSLEEKKNIVFRSGSMTPREEEAGIPKNRREAQVGAGKNATHRLEMDKCGCCRSTRVNQFES